jgi:hypothetical protein
MASSDPLGLFASGLPPEMAAEWSGLTRQQAIEQALLQQSMQPLGGTLDAGRFKVARSPLEGVAKIVQAFMAQKGLDAGDKKMADLGQRYQQGQADEVSRYVQRKAGTPGTSEAIIDETANQGEGAPATINAPGVAADPRGAVQMAILSRNPMLQKLGTLDLTHMNRQEDLSVADKRARELQGNLLADRALGRDQTEQMRRDLAAQAQASTAQIEAGRRADRAAAEAGRREDRAARLNQNPKPPKDFRWADDGSMAVIPGSATDLKMKAAKTKDERGKALLDSTLDAEIGNIDKLIGSEEIDPKTGKPTVPEHPGLNASVGVIASRIPTLRQDTADAEALQDSLRSKASISSLQTIRGTAGAIGTLTEKEWPRLEALKATLQATQGTPQFRQSLKEYRTELQRVKRLGSEALTAGADGLSVDEQAELLQLRKALGR